MVKIVLGVHVDGFIAKVAHTCVIGVALGTQVTGGKQMPLRLLIFVPKLPYDWSNLETRTQRQKSGTKLLTHLIAC